MPGLQQFQVFRQRQFVLAAIGAGGQREGHPMYPLIRYVLQWGNGEWSRATGYSDQVLNDQEMILPSLLTASLSQEV